MFTTVSFRLSAALLLLAAIGVAAADDKENNTDFFMNVFSDIGPILALFGEQFARQFLSETFTWDDHVIFACVPLGIITAISGAIRVQGHNLFKAVIGRARENHAAAEIEYMSSTSNEVCELFNGKSIVRTMGTAHIAQLIICPNHFPKPERESDNPSRTRIQSTTMERNTGSRETHTQQPVIGESEEPSEDPCGIYTLESATEKNVMYGKEYHSRFGLGLISKDKEPINHKDVEAGTSKMKGVQDGGKSPLKAWPSLRFPNLQLNIPFKKTSERRQRVYLRLASIAASTLQAALLVIAVATVYFISGYEPQPWGLPCYLFGSVLLVIGMLACSVAIERSTREFTWYIPKQPEEKSDRNPIYKNPQNSTTSPIRGLHVSSERKVIPCSEDAGDEFILLWVQRNQRVSDQDFGSYVIDGGQTNHIMTSSRCKDLKAANDPRGIDMKKQNCQNGHINSPNTNLGCGDNAADDKSFWVGLLPLIAALAGGVGFTVQYIGLRGLPWPCSVSQLGAIIAMTIIRALIRRRLTEPLVHCSVLPNYELDFLAIRLVETKGMMFGNNPGEGKSQHPHENGQIEQSPHQDVFAWKVHGGCRFSWQSADLSKDKRDDPEMGQRIIRVRNRLGNLCQWPSATSKPALALARSVEKFMNEFFPGGFPTRNTSATDTSAIQDVVRWRIPFRRSKVRDGPGVELSVIKADAATASWVVEAGQIEAILSLWRAHHEERELGNIKKKKETDWVRAAVSSKVLYHRIVGKNRRGVLKRDISWWIGNAIEGLESTSTGSSESSHHDDGPLSIGFTGPDAENSEVSEMLVQNSTADLVTIMTQHLFTSFMWSIGNLIPKNLLNRGDANINEYVKVQSSRFDLRSSIRMQAGRNLSHSKLTKYVTYAEKQGLGTSEDILLCMIPTFSFHDCLPNNAVLDYNEFEAKPFGTLTAKELSQKCIDYNHLLTCMHEQNGEKNYEYLSLAAVTDAMDFIYLMALELANAHSSTSSGKKQSANSQRKYRINEGEVLKDLNSLLKNLDQSFPSIIKCLSPFYNLQGRQKIFKNIFNRLESNNNKDIDIWSLPWTEEIQDKSFMDKIGFTDLHQEVGNLKEGENSIPKKLFGKNGMERDIFGWTALHYAAARSKLRFDLSKPESIQEGNQENDNILSTFFEENPPSDWWLDKLRRSPVHVAASSGNDWLLDILLAALKEYAKSVILTGGVDEMKLLHLAARGSHESCIDVLLKDDFARWMKNDFEVDGWKQSPIHTAVMKRNYACAEKLLKSHSFNFSPEMPDAFGRSLLSYLHEKDHMQRYLGSVILMSHQKKFEAPQNGKETILHHGIRFLDRFELDRLLETQVGPNKPVKIDAGNNHDQTPLHLAVNSQKIDLVRCLVNSGAPHSSQDKSGFSPMMLACKLGSSTLIESVLGGRKYSGNEHDKEGKTALHHAILSRNWSSDDECDQVIQMLTASMSFIDVQDQEGQTPLQCAATKKRASVCSILLRKEARIDLVDIDSMGDLYNAILSMKATDTLPNEWAKKVTQQTKKDLNVQEQNGDTKLHLAIQRNKDKTVDWLLRNEADPHIRNNSGKTPFIEACCRNVCHDFIGNFVKSNDGNLRAETDQEASKDSADNAIYEPNPSLEEPGVGIDKSVKIFDINEGDSIYDQSALAWACEYGHDEVVKILLESKNVNINRQASKFDGFTPLHFAICQENSTIVRLLLDRSGIVPSLKTANRDGLTPIAYAIKYPDKNCLKELISHRNAGPREFSIYDLGKILDICSGSNIQADDLSVWDGVAESRFYDEDKWTLAEIAGRCGHPRLEGYLQAKNDVKAKPPHRKPSTFFYVYENRELSSSPCLTHNLCLAEIIDARISPLNFDDTLNCYLRTKEAIPPDARHFYFEVKILCLPKSKVFMLGFCSSIIPEGQLPGWIPRSWAYHADDGGLYVCSGWPATANPKHICGVGDVMGCGINLKTGKGYRTRNGKLLDSEDAFKDGTFKIGKLYPCMGFKGDSLDTLKVQVVLHASKEHPFEYTGLQSNFYPQDGQAQIDPD